MNTANPTLHDGHIPWFRKSWFVVVCALVIPPVALAVLLTGDVYYKKGGQLTKYSKTIKAINVVIAVLFTILWVGRLIGLSHSDETPAASQNPVNIGSPAVAQRTPEPAIAASNPNPVPGEVSKEAILKAQLVNLNQRIQAAGAQCVKGDSDACDEVDTLKVQRDGIVESPEYKMMVASEILAGSDEPAKEDAITSTATQHSGMQQETPASAPVATEVRATPTAVPSAGVDAKTGPSFDCSKASTSVEKMICASPGLSRADAMLAESYKKTLASAGSRAVELKRREREFISRRNQCSTESCVAGEYREQLLYVGALGNGEGQ